MLLPNMRAQNLEHVPIRPKRPSARERHRTGSVLRVLGGVGSRASTLATTWIVAAALASLG
jgi:hypothetical protein